MNHERLYCCAHSNRPLFLKSLFFTTIAGMSLSFLISLSHQPSATAQVNPDDTLSTTVTSSDNRNFVIEGGDRAGNNLFHSFDEFSIPINGSAIFNNATDIELILNRVTGNQVSRINGLLQSRGIADVFLLNPHGIVFGPNASLDVGGSFIATTAEQLTFADGITFDTVSHSPLLSITTPIGLQFGTESEAIRGRGNKPSRLSRTDDLLLQPLSRDIDRVHLQGAAGHTLALLGNGLSFTGSNLVADNGHLALGSIQSGWVELTQDDDIWEFSYGGVDRWNDIRLRSQSALDVSGTNSHGIQLVGRNIHLTDGSLAFVQALGNADAADINVMASDRLLLRGTNQEVTVPSGLRHELLNLTAVPRTISQGDILINASEVVVDNGAEISIPNYSVQTSGSIQLNVAGLIAVEGVSSLDPIRFSRIGIAAFSDGNGGNVNVTGQQLLISDGASLSSISVGNGNGGNVHLDIAESIDLVGLGPTSAGVLRPSSTIDASTVGQGNAGGITIRTGSLLIDNGNVTSTSLAGGDAGIIDIEAESVEMMTSRPGFTAELTSAAKANNPLQIALNLPRIPTGNAGSLSLQTSRLHLQQDAVIAVENQGPGDAGRMRIEGDWIVLQNGSRINAATEAGASGNLEVDVRDVLVLQQESFISAEARGAEDGGNINLSGPFIIGLNNSDIIANAFEGDGGNISITTQGLFGLEFRPGLTRASDITASSNSGVSGTVDINSPNVDPNSNVLELPQTFIEGHHLIRSGCSLGEDQFVLAGRGGLPSSPTGTLRSDRPWIDTRDLSAFLSQPSPNRPSHLPSTAIFNAVPPAPIQEATRLAIGPSGNVQLVSSNAQHDISPHPTCRTYPPML